MEGPFVNNCVVVAESLVEKAPGVGEREIGRHSRDAVDHAESGGNHGSREHNSGKPWAAVRDQVESNARKDHK